MKTPHCQVKPNSPSPPVREIATEMTVPIVTNYSDAPIMTIVLQVVHNKIKQTNEKEEDDEERNYRESIKEEMTSAWRVISFFFIVFILPTLLISIPLYARYHIYHAKSHFFTDGDMKSFHQDVSSFWCQGQRLLSNGTFEAYLTKEARRSRKKRISSLSSNILLQHDEIEEWGVYLIRGSHFKFSTCSRWPGGTLLVVQGEENLRRCFYREERFQEEMKEVKKTEVQKPLFKHNEHSPIIDDKEEDATEIMEGEEEILLKEDIIRKLYSSARFKKNPKNIDYNKTLNSTIKLLAESQHSHNITLNSETSTNTKGDEKQTRKRKSKKERKKKHRKEKLSKGKEGAKNETNIDPAARNISKRSVNSENVDKKFKTESIKVDGGSLFFNINDTLDVTTGNSSFSSSEEFLRQCSDTIVSIDLSPYPDCSQRSLNLNESAITWKFRVNTSDFHYFIFTSDNSLETNVISFNIMLERRLFNVSDNIQNCSNSSECVLPFSFMKSEGVIIDFHDHFENVTNLSELNNYEVTSICQPRTLVYTIFILCVPFIIVLFAFR